MKLHLLTDESSEKSMKELIGDLPSGDRVAVLGGDVDYDALLDLILESDSIACW